MFPVLALSSFINTGMLCNHFSISLSGLQQITRELWSRERFLGEGIAESQPCPCSSCHCFPACSLASDSLDNSWCLMAQQVGLLPSQSPVPRTHMVEGEN